MLAVPAATFHKECEHSLMQTRTNKNQMHHGELDTLLHSLIASSFFLLAFLLPICIS